MKRIVKIGFRHADSVPFRAPSHPAPQYARGLCAPAKRPLRDGDRSIREQHSRAPAVLDRQTRESRRRVFPVLRADKPTHAIAAGSRVSAVCTSDTRTATARTRGSRRRNEGSVRRMKRIVKIGFRHADSVPFRALSHPAPQYARRLYAPAKLPLWESNPSIRERHSCAPAIPERQPRERARRRHVVLTFRVDKPVPTSIAGSRASAVCACSTRTANVQRAEAVSPLSSFSARTSPPTQSLPEVAYLPYAPTISERQPRERARRRHVVLAFRVDKPVPTSIAGSHASAVYACSTRTANVQRAEDVSVSFPFSARTSPPTQSLPEVACLSYASAIPERRTRECARRRHVVLAFRVDKPVPTSIAGSRASAVCACGNRPENAQRAEDVSASFPFSAQTRPPTQSLPEVACLSYASAIPERQPRERARRRHVVLTFRVDKPVPTSIAGSRASAVCACSTRTANVQRAEAVSPLSSFSARTSPPTQSLPEVAYLPYAPAIPERRTRDCAEAVAGTKGACAG